MVQNPNSPEAIKEPAEETTGKGIPDPVNSKDALIGTTNDSSEIAIFTSGKEKESPRSSKMKKHNKGSLKSPASNNSKKVFCLTMSGSFLLFLKMQFRLLYLGHLILLFKFFLLMNEICDFVEARLELSSMRTFA